jgi:hypothetical protein
MSTRGREATASSNRFALGVGERIFEIVGPKSKRREEVRPVRTPLLHRQTSTMESIV